MEPTYPQFQKHVLGLSRNWPIAKSDPADRLAQGILGLVSELYELRLACLKNDLSQFAGFGDEILVELGDAWFYTALVGSTVPGCVEDALKSGDGGHLPAASFRVGYMAATELTGVAEKIAFQHHPLSDHAETIRLRLTLVVRSLNRFGPAEDAWAANIEKLHTRYPDGFTVMDSIARIDQGDA